MTDPKQYATRDHIALGDHYLRHVSAMTAEGLHAKSDIAAELAWRDQQIEALRDALKGAVDLSEFWINREDRRGMSESDYRMWYALGHGSNAMRDARAAPHSEVTK